MKKGSRDKDGVPQMHANFNLANSNFRFQIRQFFFCYSCFAFTARRQQKKNNCSNPRRNETTPKQNKNIGSKTNIYNTLTISLKQQLQNPQTTKSSNITFVALIVIFFFSNNRNK